MILLAKWKLHPKMLPKSFTNQFLKKLELFQLSSRKKYLSLRQGMHVSLKRGHGLEFSDYRKYEPGDDPRHIDWGVYARSEKLYVKKFAEEQSIHIGIVIDTSQSMFQPEQSKFNTAVELALAIAYIALAQGDSVHLAAPGLFETAKASGARNIHQLADQVVHEKEKQLDFNKGLDLILAKLSYPGILIYISDFLEEQHETRRILQRFISKNLDTYAIQILSHEDQNPVSYLSDAQAVDSETGEVYQYIIDQNATHEYQELLSIHNKKLTQVCHALNIPIIKINSTDDLEAIITKEMPKLGLLI